MKDNGADRVSGDLWLASDRVARGYAFDAKRPAARLAVEILADGLPIALVSAQERIDAHHTLPCDAEFCGFSVLIDEEVLARTQRLVAHLANTDTVLGTVEVGGIDPMRNAKPQPIGHAHWVSGLLISGHVQENVDPHPVPYVKALVDGTEVARCSCRSWVQLQHGQIARAFDIHLPEIYADGRVRAVTLVTNTGLELPGSPCLVVAFPTPLEDWIDGWAEVQSETLRARFTDGLLPQSVPFQDLEGLLSRFALPDPNSTITPRVAVVIVGDVGRDVTIASLEEQKDVDWSAAALASDRSPLRFDARQLRTFLNEEASDCNLVIMVVSGASFEHGALARMHHTAECFPYASAIYPDILIRTTDGLRWLLAFPTFDSELFSESAYCGLAFGIRRSVALSSLDKCPSLFDLFPTDDWEPSSTAPVHIPIPLVTLPDLPDAARQDALVAGPLGRLALVDGEATIAPGGGWGRPSTRILHGQSRVDVAVLIAAGDNGPALTRTLSSLEATCSSIVKEIVIADHGSTDPLTLKVLDGAKRRGCTVLVVPGWFCVPHLLNRASAIAQSEQVLFLEAGISGLEAGWLEEMLSRSERPKVGAVGGLVAWPSGVIRDAGFILGSKLSIAPRFTDRKIGDEGYAGLLKSAHQCSALSTACLLTRRHLLDKVGGFDVSTFPTVLYAADFCLRLREAGQRIIFTPHARLRFDGLEAMPPHLSSLQAVAERETRLFRHRWTVSPGCDPFYSPWMTMNGSPYSGLAWPPSSLRPRQPVHLVARPIPAGF